MVERILAHYRAASAVDAAKGIRWYADAHDLADALAAGAAPITTAQAGGVIAALSPRVAWPVNVRAATIMVDAYASGDDDPPVVAGTLRNRRKAWRILSEPGTDPLDVLGGPKVRAFYGAIMGDPDVVCVDVWAARAAEGPDYRPAAPTGKRYAAIADAYRAAADIAGIAPRDMQAIVWTYCRRVNARADYGD